MTALRDAARLLAQLAGAPLATLRRQRTVDDPCDRDCPTGCLDRGCSGTWC